MPYTVWRFAYQRRSTTHIILNLIPPENAALPHGSGTDRVLGESDFALFDCMASLHGYYSDVTRVLPLTTSSTFLWLINCPDRQWHCPAPKFQQDTNRSGTPSTLLRERLYVQYAKVSWHTPLMLLRDRISMLKAMQRSSPIDWVTVESSVRPGTLGLV